MWQRIASWARRMRHEISALLLAARDPRTPSAAKLVALIVTAYALSPIDLIPDFIPVLGLIDDLILVPLGILLAIRLVPKVLMQEFRAQAMLNETARDSKFGAIIVIGLWLFFTALAVAWLM